MNRAHLEEKGTKKSPYWLLIVLGGAIIAWGIVLAAVAAFLAVWTLIGDVNSTTAAFGLPR